MVAILEAEHGARISFATGDVDALVDVRAMIGVTLAGARRLLDAGVEPDPGGARDYRYVRDGAIVDVPAPETSPSASSGSTRSGPTVQRWVQSSPKSKT